SIEQRPPDVSLSGGRTHLAPEPPRLGGRQGGPDERNPLHCSSSETRKPGTSTFTTRIGSRPLASSTQADGRRSRRTNSPTVVGPRSLGPGARRARSTSLHSGASS